MQANFFGATWQLRQLREGLAVHRRGVGAGPGQPCQMASTFICLWSSLARMVCVGSMGQGTRSLSRGWWTSEWFHSSEGHGPPLLIT